MRATISVKNDERCPPPPRQHGDDLYALPACRRDECQSDNDETPSTSGRPRLIWAICDEPCMANAAAGFTAMFIDKILISLSRQTAAVQIRL